MIQDSDMDVMWTQNLYTVFNTIEDNCDGILCSLGYDTHPICMVVGE